MGKERDKTNHYLKEKKYFWNAGAHIKLESTRLFLGIVTLDRNKRLQKQKPI